MLLCSSAWRTNVSLPQVSMWRGSTSLSQVGNEKEEMGVLTFRAASVCRTVLFDRRYCQLHHLWCSNPVHTSNCRCSVCVRAYQCVRARVRVRACFCVCVCARVCVCECVFPSIATTEEEKNEFKKTLNRIHGDTRHLLVLRRPYIAYTVTPVTCSS